MGACTAFLQGHSYRTPCPRSRRMTAWARRTIGWLNGEVVPAPLPTLRSSAIARRLQPRLRRRHVLLECDDVLGVLEGEPDIVEAFKQTHAVGRRDIEGDIRPARP